MEQDIDVAAVGYTDDARWSTTAGELRTGVTNMTAIHLAHINDRPTDYVQIELSGINWSDNGNSVIIFYAGDTIANAKQLHIEVDEGSWKVIHNGDGKATVIRKDTARTIDGFKCCGVGKGANAVIKVKHV